jgi:dTDP-4-dehydrorhamnose reductase
MLRLADQETLRVVGDQRGTPSAAADIASVIWSSAGILNSGQFKQVLHFSSSPATTWFGFAAAVFETARALGILTRVPRLQKISSEEYPSATRRPANSVLDSSRLSNLLAFKPPDWRVSLRKVLEDIRDDAQRNRAPG